MQIILSKLVRYLKGAFPDFAVGNKFQKSTLTYWFYSKMLNQIVIVKFPGRAHYITKDLARIYLTSSRNLVENELGEAIVKRSYVLNILISDRLTKGCLDLITPGVHGNMDMVFNSKVRSEEDILVTIFNSLANKFESWVNKIKSSASKENTRYVNTSAGTMQVKKKIKPYGPLKNQIHAVNDAIFTLKSAANEFKYKRRGV